MRGANGCVTGAKRCVTDAKRCVVVPRGCWGAEGSVGVLREGRSAKGAMGVTRRVGCREGVRAKGVTTRVGVPR